MLNLVQFWCDLFTVQALQEEVRSQQPQLNALQRQFEQLAPHASPEGLQVLKSKQDSVRRSFEDANSAVAERQRTLASALQHRRDFYGRLNDVEKWVKKMQRKLDSGSEIYSDEVGDTLARLKVLFPTDGFGCSCVVVVSLWTFCIIPGQTPGSVRLWAVCGLFVYCLSFTPVSMYDCVCVCVCVCVHLAHSCASTHVDVYIMCYC